MWWHVNCSAPHECTWTPYNKIENEKQYKEKNCVFCLRKYFSFRILLHLCKCSAFHFLAQISFSYMEAFSWLGLTFPYKSSLLKELYYFEFCYVICWICFRSVLVVFLGVFLLFCYSAALLMFHCSEEFRLFRLCFVVSPVFRYSASFPVFRQCSGVPPMFRRCSVFHSSVFRCSRFYSMLAVFRWLSAIKFWYMIKLLSSLLCWIVEWTKI